MTDIDTVTAYYAAFNRGDWDGMCAFLTEDVTYRASPRQTVIGRHAVIGMIGDIRSTFDECRTSLINVALSVDVVLAEQALRLRLAGCEPQWVMSFSSFRMDGLRICAWHQLNF